MRHQFNRLLELRTGAQKQSNVVRNLLTSLVTHGTITTTPKRAKVLKSQADSFFAGIVALYTTKDATVAKREAMRMTKSTLFTDVAGKKVLNDLVPLWLQNKKQTGFVMDVKLGPRAGDATEKVLVRIV